MDTTRPQRKRGPRNTWTRNLEKEMWMAGLRYSWRKMEVAAQDKSWMESGGLYSLYFTGSDKAKYTRRD